MDEDAEPELAGQGDRSVPARIVDEDDLVHPVARDVVERSLERLLGVVRGHDDDDFFCPRFRFRHVNLIPHFSLVL